MESWPSGLRQRLAKASSGVSLVESSNLSLSAISSFPCSSVVEQTTVNRWVRDSISRKGAKNQRASLSVRRVLVKQERSAAVLPIGTCSRQPLIPKIVGGRVGHLKGIVSRVGLAAAVLKTEGPAMGVRVQVSPIPPFLTHE